MNLNEINPAEAARLKKINLSLLVLFAIVIGSGELAFGLDFAKGALVGCIVVAFNFYMSQYLLARLFVPGQPRGPIVTFYLLKFGLSMAFLIVSLLYFKVDLWGVMAGLSTLFLIMLLTSFFRASTAPEQPTEEQQ